MQKFIFVTGGVVSGLGKGVSGASIGRLLKNRGYTVTMIKLDPYLNVDPGTLSPYQHGEVFVTDNGSETDLDLGHYERFIDENLSQLNSITSGKIYTQVLSDEREGKFNGGTVQVIPHVTQYIKNSIKEGADGYDIAIVEIGGTVGDIESQPFLEAIRQLAGEIGLSNCAFCHVTLVPYLRFAGELKTKPTQHSVRTLRSYGIQPTVLICRCDMPLPDSIRRKLAFSCDIESDCVISDHDLDSLYAVPLMFAEQSLDELLLKKLGLEVRSSDLMEWRDIVRRITQPRSQTRVALVGKYTELHDSYLSVMEALTHAGAANDAHVNIDWVNSECLNESNVDERLKDANAILVPGGFGTRGIDGMLCAIRYARENKVPFLGICLGLQLAVIDYARSVCGMTGAHTTEIDPQTPYPVIDIMPDQVGVQLGGTMRMGLYECVLNPATRAMAAYGSSPIFERHRHRYEVNNKYRDKLFSGDLIISGGNPERNLIEIVELKDHPWFVSVQFHPEFKSRPNRAQPLFRDFIAAALKEDR